MGEADILRLVEQYEPVARQVAQSLWNCPELSGKEEKSCQLMKEILTEHGFSVKNVAEEYIPYAFQAEYGHGAPVVAVLADFDALPGLSQKASAVQESVVEGGPGHGCGHNLIAGSSIGAVLAVKDYLQQRGQSGTVRFYACPAEEICAGKAYMIKAGAFEGCDVAVQWHPTTTNLAYERAYLAVDSYRFRFHGVTSHAAIAPHLGRSALDAVELMNVGVNYLREHVVEKARIHYIITHGGTAPNIVPKYAESLYFVRAPLRSDVQDIARRIKKIAEGAAMMTETAVEMEKVSGCYELLPNRVLRDVAYANLEKTAYPELTPEEEAFAAKLQGSVGEAELAGELTKFELERSTTIHRGLIPIDVADKAVVTASDDIGDVSWTLPVCHFSVAVWPVGSAAHTWCAAAASGSSVGFKAQHYAAKIMAQVARDLYERPELVELARQEFQKRTEGFQFLSAVD
ncbi:MAG: amidohydrolase [Lawsonibacter sp.]|nr:amidohydrolase [Lawsonibacter sp.]